MTVENSGSSNNGNNNGVDNIHKSMFELMGSKSRPRATNTLPPIKKVTSAPATPPPPLRVQQQQQQQIFNIPVSASMGGGGNGIQPGGSGVGTAASIVVAGPGDLSGGLVVGSAEGGTPTVNSVPTAVGSSFAVDKQGNVIPGSQRLTIPAGATVTPGNPFLSHGINDFGLPASPSPNPLQLDSPLSSPVPPPPAAIPSFHQAGFSPAPDLEPASVSGRPNLKPSPGGFHPSGSVQFNSNNHIWRPTPAPPSQQQQQQQQQHVRPPRHHLHHIEQTSRPVRFPGSAEKRFDPEGAGEEDYGGYSYAADAHYYSDYHAAMEEERQQPLHNHFQHQQQAHYYSTTPPPHAASAAAAAASALGYGGGLSTPKSGVNIMAELAPAAQHERRNLLAASPTAAAAIAATTPGYAGRTASAVVGCYISSRIFLPLNIFD